MDPNEPTPSPIASRVRGIANTVLLIGALVFLIGWAAHFPVRLMASLGLLLLLAFIVSSVAIAIENRHHDGKEGDA